MPGAGFETQTVAERVRRIVSILDCDDYEQVYGLRFDTAIPALIDFQGKTHVYVTATLDGQSRAIKELGHKLDRVHEALERHPSRHDAHLPLTLKVMWEALQQIHPLQSQMRNLESRMQSMEEKQADNTSLRDHIARIEADLNKLREEHSELQRTQHEYEDIQSKWEQMHSTQEQRMSDLERKYTDWARKEIADLRKTFERDLQGRVGNMEKAVERALDVFRADTKRTIDTNTHEDLAVYDTRLEALRMGVTTILRGEMGKSFQSLKTECDSVRRKTQEFTETCVERARRDQEKNFEVALTASREALDKKIDESIEVNKREALLAEGRPEGRAEGKLSGGWEVLRKEMEHHRTMSEEELGRCKREVLSLIQRVDKTTGDTEARMKAVEQSLETLEGTMDTLTARVENQVTMLVQQCTLIEGKNDELDRTLDLQAQVRRLNKSGSTKYG
jgi:chromosome segregation ATPase